MSSCFFIIGLCRSVFSTVGCPDGEKTVAVQMENVGKMLILNNVKFMPYFNTNNIELAVGFADCINKKMQKLKGYKCAKFFSRIEDQYVEKYGKYRVGLNMWQSEFLEIAPSVASMFSEDDVKKILERESEQQ